MHGKTLRKVLRGKWKVQVKKICRKLGRYTCADVSSELRKRARLHERQMDRAGPFRTTLTRKNVGHYIPTNKQLQQHLARADWSVEAVPGDKHHQAVYEFSEGPCAIAGTSKGEPLRGRPGTLPIES